MKAKRSAVTKHLDHRLCVAPMMEWTDRHDRYFLRRITRHALLYTEMLTDTAITHGDSDRLLAFHPDERPLALQVGGSTPETLAHCAMLAETFDYDEVNLNVGCPSPRVKSGRFGACLMAEPVLVAQCVQAMREATRLPVTVKTRIGIDELDSYEHLHEFVSTIAHAGCSTLVVHARKAWLNGMSAKDNREVPPLHYDRVYRVKQDFPSLEVVINGGIRTLDEANDHLCHVDGVMMGRAAYQNPYCLALSDHSVFGSSAAQPSRHDVVRAMYPYIQTQLAAGVRLARITRHMLGLFQGVPGARAWRRYLSEHAHHPHADVSTLHQALQSVPETRDEVSPA